MTDLKESFCVSKFFQHIAKGEYSNYAETDLDKIFFNSTLISIKDRLINGSYGQGSLNSKLSIVGPNIKVSASDLVYAVNLVLEYKGVADHIDHVIEQAVKDFLGKELFASEMAKLFEQDRISNDNEPVYLDEAA